MESTTPSTHASTSSMMTPTLFTNQRRSMPDNRFFFFKRFHLVRRTGASLLLLRRPICIRSPRPS